jgi:hypothetical protein
MGNVNKLEGNYSNYLKIGQNAFEFLFDFGQFYRESEEAHFHTRIITSPVYAKAFLRVLKECIDQYERTFAVIPHADEEIIGMEVSMDG